MKVFNLILFLIGVLNKFGVDGAFETANIAVILKDKNPICLGIVYNNLWVITVGICLTFNSESRYRLNVVIGSEKRIRYLVKDIKYPPDNTFDIALVKLETPIEDNKSTGVKIKNTDLKISKMFYTINFKNEQFAVLTESEYIEPVYCEAFGESVKICVRYFEKVTYIPMNGAPLLNSNDDLIGLRLPTIKSLETRLDSYTDVQLYIQWINDEVSQKLF